MPNSQQPTAKVNFDKKLKQIISTLSREEQNHLQQAVQSIILTSSQSPYFFTKANTQEYPIERIHFIWFGSMVPKKYIENLKRWRELNSQIAMNLWFYSSCLKEQERLNLINLATELGIILRDIQYERNLQLYSIILNEVLACRYYSASDTCRFAFLFKEGGLYVDMDTKPTQSLPKKVIADHGFLVGISPVPRIDISIFYAGYQKHYLVKKILDGIEDSFSYSEEKIKPLKEQFLNQNTSLKSKYLFALAMTGMVPEIIIMKNYIGDITYLKRSIALPFLHGIQISHDSVSYKKTNENEWPYIHEMYKHLYKGFSNLEKNSIFTFNEEVPIYPLFVTR